MVGSVLVGGSNEVKVLNLEELLKTVNIDIAELTEVPLAADQGDGWVKQVVKTKRLTISQLLITQSANLPLEISEKASIYIVLDGQVTIGNSVDSYDLKKGALIYFPSGVRTRIKVQSPRVEFLVVEVLESTGNGQPLREYGTWVESCGPEGRVFIVQPEDPPAYEPANHSATTNRCLFINDDVEVIRGKINAGGGADKHAHEGFEQMTYVIEPREANLLVYIPPGVAHGGEKYEVSLDLLVIYSPSYRESLKYGKEL